MNLRPLSDLDASARSFVLDTWRRSLPKRHRRAPGRSHSNTDRLREKLVDAHHVLCATGDGGAIFGWVCYTPLRTTAVIHYVYVRAPLRGTGIGRTLLAATGVALDRPVAVTSATAEARARAGRAGVRLVETQASEVM